MTIVPSPTLPYGLQNAYSKRKQKNWPLIQFDSRPRRGLKRLYYSNSILNASIYIQVVSMLVRAETAMR
jgi:hypothetical protein